MSLFISFEGGEGSGKSTQAGILCDSLTGQGYRVVRVQEPGTTDLGNHLRSYLKSTNSPLTPEAEVFLFAAARSELVRRVALPALELGKVIVADRYADSTTAYQGYGRRVPLRNIRSANDLATAGRWPDITFLLDVPVDVGLNRARVQTSLDDDRDDSQRDRDGSKRAEESDEQRFESAGMAFHKRVRDGYLKLAAREPERWVVLDAGMTEDVLAQQVWDRVSRDLEANATGLEGMTRLPGF
jgi:dTMP kinase